MAIFPPDDIALSAAIRKRVRPLEDSYRSDWMENVRRNPPTRGAGQGRDLWGRTKWWATMDFKLGDEDSELLNGFLETYRATIGFTAFDFKFRTFGNPAAGAGYRPKMAIGTATGAAQTFTIPAKEVSAGYVLYHSGSTVIPAGSITAFSQSGGAQGEATISIAAAAAPAASPISMALTCRARFTVELPDPPSCTSAGFKRWLISLRIQEKF